MKKVKDIGSIYPVDSVVADEKGELPFWRHEAYIHYFSLCRQALATIARRHKNHGVVLLPAYTCDTVVNAFTSHGFKCRYYGVHKNLTIDEDTLIRAFERGVIDILIVHPFFGMELSPDEMELLRHLKAKYADVIFVMDLTQCIFSSVNDCIFDYYTGSLRKWFPIPDGAFLSSATELKAEFRPSEENIRYVDLELAAMYLRGEYFETGDCSVKRISREVDKAAQGYAESLFAGFKMSAYSHSVLSNYDVQKMAEARMRNFTFLHENIQSELVIEMCDDVGRMTTAPLYFPILTKQRDLLNSEFIKNSIYAPIIWPVPNEDTLITDEIREIYNSVIALPVDHRYTNDDMERICAVINRMR